MPSALCFRLRPAEDPFDRANQQTAVRDWTMDLLAYGTVCCAAHDRQEAAPEDEPEVKHELGAENIPEVDNLHATEGNTDTRKLS